MVVPCPFSEVFLSVSVVIRRIVRVTAGSRYSDVAHHMFALMGLDMEQLRSSSSKWQSLVEWKAITTHMAELQDQFHGISLHSTPVVVKLSHEKRFSLTHSLTHPLTHSLTT